MKNYFEGENLSQDVIHGFIPLCAPTSENEEGEKTERDIIDSPWFQRLRQIFQLQTAWFVYPTAEHTRFQHSLGVMHLAGKMIAHLYPSLREETLGDGDLPSRHYIVSLMRVAALLHDVGHGPFGHFFDSHFLAEFGLTHEKVGAEIIRRHFAGIIRRIRRNPWGKLAEHEFLDPEQVAMLIVRPENDETGEDRFPRWLRLLRTLFCGLYTVDNMDFVLRDAYMTGLSRHAFNADRLMHYTFFSPQGLTIHQKGLSTLVQFLGIRAELFRSVYFHRTVRAVDLTLAELFEKSREHIFPLRGDGSRHPLENLEDYRLLTDRTLLSEVSFWDRSDIPRRRALAPLWYDFLQRRIPWKLVGETTAIFPSTQREQSSIFSDPTLFETAIRAKLPSELRNIELRVDIARHLHRPGAFLPSRNQNCFYDMNSDSVRPLEEDEVFRMIPRSFKICRVYSRDPAHRKIIGETLNKLVSSEGGDDLTNM